MPTLMLHRTSCFLCSATFRRTMSHGDSCTDLPKEELASIKRSGRPARLRSASGMQGRRGRLRRAWWVVTYVEYIQSSLVMNQVTGACFLLTQASVGYDLLLSIS